MAYQIYHQVKMLKKHDRIRPGAAYGQNNRSTVKTAEFSSPDHSVIISRLFTCANPGDMVSIAVNSSNVVIALVNHSRKTKCHTLLVIPDMREFFSLIFYLAFPILIGGGIAWQTRTGFPAMAYCALAVTIGICLILLYRTFIDIEGFTAQKEIDAMPLSPNSYIRTISNSKSRNGRPASRDVVPPPKEKD